MAEPEYEVVETLPVEVPGSPSPPALADQYTRVFQDLLPEAVKQVRRILKNSQSEKMILMAAHDIFDRAGASKKGVSENRPIIEIKDSNVALLVQAAKEALE